VLYYRTLAAVKPRNGPHGSVTYGFSAGSKTPSWAGLTFRRKFIDSAEAVESWPRQEREASSMQSEYDRPRVFIGSSSEGKRVAEFLQLGLNDEMETTIWWQGVFGLSGGTLESLVHATASYDFAVLVLTPDDLVEKRGSQSNAPRDNVLLELGMFIGAIGRKRTFIVYPSDEQLELPSDLAGVTAATYRSRRDTNLLAALGPVCTQIKVAARQVLGLPLDAVPEDTLTFEERQHVARRRRRRSLGTACVACSRKTHRVVDISVSGALLETDGEIPIGQLLELDLELDTTRRACVVAKVVRVQEPAWGVVGGVGVVFTQYEGDSVDIIEQYVTAEDTIAESTNRLN